MEADPTPSTRTDSLSNDIHKLDLSPDCKGPWQKKQSSDLGQHYWYSYVYYLIKLLSVLTNYMSLYIQKQVLKEVVIKDVERLGYQPSTVIWRHLFTIQVNKHLKICDASRWSEIRWQSLILLCQVCWFKLQDCFSTWA